MSDRPVTLKSPRYLVVMGDPDADPDTWDTYEVQTVGRDMSRAETIMARNKWGTITEHPMKYNDLLAWCALTRRGDIDLTWERFEQAYIECQPLTGVEGNVPEALASPTLPAPAGD